MDKPMYQATREDLLLVPTPQQTKTYKPITHKELIDLTLESIYQSGFKVDKQIYSSSNGGLIAKGIYTISDIKDSEMQLMIGWQNSYNKQVTLKFAIGAHIFLCTNGCVSGSFGSFKRKHTGEVQTFTPQAISDYIKGAGDVFVNLQTQRNHMKGIGLSQRRKAELIGRMLVEHRFINPTQSNMIIRELDHPTFDYGCPNSMWELYQFVTYALRTSHPSEWMDAHIEAHNFFTGESTISISAESTIYPNLLDAIQEPSNQLDLEDAIREAESTQHLDTPMDTIIEPVDEFTSTPVVPEEIPVGPGPESFDDQSTEENEVVTEAVSEDTANYLVKVMSEDDEGNEKEYTLKVYAANGDEAEEMARKIFDFDFPMKPIDYVTVNRIL